MDTLQTNMMTLVTSIFVGLAALFIASIGYTIVVAYLTMRRFTPPTGVEVSFAIGSVLYRPSFWVISIGAFTLGFYWAFGRR